MIASNLSVLQIIIPLLCAPFCTMLTQKRLSWFCAAIVTYATFACSLALLSNVYMSGAISYALGGWAAPYGIEYRIDNLNSIFLVLVSGIASVTITYAAASVEKEIDVKRQPFFYSLYLLLLAGLLGIVITNDIFNIYVFLEISSLATYALVAMGKDKRALVAAFEYLIMATIGATFILIAIGLLYSMTGSLNISDIATRIIDVESTMPIKMALAFFTVGLALKIAILPLHLWLTNAYTNAPSFVASFLSATATKVGLYVLIRILFFIFGKEFSFTTLPVGQIFIVLGVLAMLVGSTVAIMQDNLKRLLAYSSVAQIGYIIVGIGVANMQGISASLLHIIFHALAKSAMFMSAGAMFFRMRNVRINTIAGVGRLMPVTTAVFIIGGLSLIGIPGTAGFVSKWYLLQAAIKANMWPLFTAILFSSLLTLTYIWKIIEVAYFARPKATKQGVREVPIIMIIPMVLLSALTIILGIFPEYINLYIGRVAVLLFG